MSDNRPTFIIQRINGKRRRVKVGDMWKVTNSMGSLTWLVVSVESVPKRAELLLVKLESSSNAFDVYKPNLGTIKWININEGTVADGTVMTLVARV